MDESAHEPGIRASDVDRAATVAQLQAALGEGRIDLVEFGERSEAAYAAVTTAELAPLVADLPGGTVAPRVEIIGERSPETITGVFGDIRIEGAASVPGRASTVFGDVRIDLRGLRTDTGVVELHLGSVFGDVEVIVAEGVAAELNGWTVFGDRRTELAAVPRLAGTPRIVVHARTMFGDLRLRSLAPGESTSRWRALLERLAQPRQP